MTPTGSLVPTRQENDEKFTFEDKFLSLGRYSLANLIHSRKFPFPILFKSSRKNFITSISIGSFAVLQRNYPYAAYHPTKRHSQNQSIRTRRYFFEGDALFRIHCSWSRRNCFPTDTETRTGKVRTTVSTLLIRRLIRLALFDFLITTKFVSYLREFFRLGICQVTA